MDQESGHLSGNFQREVVVHGLEGRLELSSGGRPEAAREL
jgi:hypothetical protein